MVNKHISLEDLFADIADAIREKTGNNTETIPAAEFPNMIRNRLQITHTAPPPPCLTFRSPNSFTLKVSNTTKHWDGTLEYSTDKKMWIVWNGETTLSSVASGNHNVLHLRGTGNTVITGNSAIIGDSNNHKWVLTGSDIVCSGNIETLLDYTTVQAGNHPTMANYCYAYMFEDCESLIAAPRLPATILTTSCYDEMFQGCKSLTIAPELPATTLAGWCYHSMFKDCTNLITVPALPATTLDSNCYERMFQGCLALTTVPALPATTLAETCYDSMFKNCTNLTAIPALPATTLTKKCYHEMFQGCINLKLSRNNIGKYTQAYRIPTIGNGTTALLALTDMFDFTGDDFLGTPDINTTYYLSKANTIIG